MRFMKEGNVKSDSKKEEGWFGKCIGAGADRAGSSTKPATPPTPTPSTPGEDEENHKAVA